jgi:hypothetical protein
MKKLYILLFTILITSLSFGQTVFINEIHYDDTGADTGEGFEIAGPAGTDLTNWTVAKYNGSNNAVYGTENLSGTIPDEGGGFGALWFALPSNGLQNGPAEGLALVAADGTTVIQFLSYEGVLTAIDGPAVAMMSTDIGVAEAGEIEGNSLQLSGTGLDYTNFSWNAPSAVSLGLINPGQTFGTPVPTLTIFDGPANGNSVIDDPETATQATIDFTTTNFIMSNDAGGGVSDFSGDGYIVWSIENTVGSVFVDGGNIFTSNDGFEYTVTGLAIGETYFFTSELVDNTGASLSSPVVYSFTITIASYTDVADLAALRASPVGPDFYYRVLGPVINTNTISATEQTMYFQDGTAGIMVYDPDFEVQSYNIGNAVSNIRGHLVLVSDVLQFIPTFADWGTPDTTGNSVGIPTVTIATLLTNWEDYESELVRVNGATFADAGGTFVNAIGGTGNYNIIDATGTTIFRSAFSNADYIGQTIPSGNQDLVVIVAEFFGSVQVTSRGLSDITLDIKSNEIGGFNIYPNPTSLGYINIFSKNNAEMNVSVFDILGKQVINTVMTSEKLNVSTLNTGVYIMKITQGKATSTKKLVIN